MLGETLIGLVCIPARRGRRGLARVPGGYGGVAVVRYGGPGTPGHCGAGPGPRLSGESDGGLFQITVITPTRPSPLSPPPHTTTMVVSSADSTPHTTTKIITTID